MCTHDILTYAGVEEAQCLDIEMGNVILVMEASLAVCPMIMSV